MTLEELKKSGHIIFECISGSRAYGLSTPTSDTDIRGVFVLPQELFYSMDYIGQINNESNDIVYYELRKFLELCANNNPNILELLNVPEKCVLYKHPIFEMVKMSFFLSKKCEISFANYAYAQIKKARGLEKKIVNPVEKKRKSVLDFCFVLESGTSVLVEDFLKKRNLNQEDCGLARIPHMRDCFNLYSKAETPYKGIMKNDSSNEVAISSIPKGEEALIMLFFNKDAYSSYCKKYREYWDWVKKRNQDRYATTIAHGKNYDSKNMMHTFRLLLMAKEIALEGTINVERSDRTYLLDIKNGKFEYDELVKCAEELKEELSELYEKSKLPDLPNRDRVNQLLVAMRKEFYSNE
ncbi:MAG: nucleotidyltransferase domain-containing protein [Crocinitomicaceae bacterium]|nr:nucleotidyltransferase domain-containing protein [Flavobacteriales bacterium]NQZ36606.1 nucleotidyltransferase domain-containing protein [Crocinitomicaceae bacterium]